jgi:hypothetical protein
MKLPIGTGSVKFAAAGPLEAVLDYETRAPKLEGSGAALFSVPLFAVGTGIRDSCIISDTQIAGHCNFNRNFRRPSLRRIYFRSLILRNATET